MVEERKKDCARQEVFGKFETHSWNGQKRKSRRKSATSRKPLNDNTQRGKTDAGVNLSETTEERKGRKNRYDGTWGKLPHSVVYLLRHKIPGTRPRVGDWISDLK